MLDSNHCQGVHPNPESAAGPADSRQATPAVHFRGRPVPSAASFAALMATSTQRAELGETIRFQSLQAAFLRVGVDLPPISTPAASETPPAEFSLNIPLQSAMSEYVRRVRPSLVEFVELVRCQTPDDYRPNKALVPSALRHVCKGYEHLDSLIQIASEGIRVRLTKPLPRQRRFPRNHPSAADRINVLRKNIRKEQDLFRCIVLDADVAEGWPELFMSPFGVVDKGSGDPSSSGKVIHDLSHPDESSVNLHTDASDVPKPTYAHCSCISQEITRCKRAHPASAVKVMTGDVASAYRNACTHSHSVHLFEGSIPEDNAIVIDMSAAFGWTGSAGTYSILGGAVAFVHGQSYDGSRPTGMFNYHWVDDHVNVAPAIGSLCAESERSLRYAMVAVMGPAAVNEEKFTPWRTRQKVLGLVFDTASETVAMPVAKIEKAKRLVAAAFGAENMSRSEYRSLLGSLRHVASCVRPAHAFLQRLRDGERHLHRRVRVQVTPSMREDLAWWWHILRDPALNGVPLDFFAALPQPDFTITTDASDDGICALLPALRSALTYRFSPSERQEIAEFKDGAKNAFDINYSELLACAFAVQEWAPALRRARPQASLVHVHFRIDNTSAVAWQSKMASRNPRAQTLIRLLSFWEQTFGFRFSASHIRGVENTAADAGSRQWMEPRYATIFNKLTSGWTQATTLRSIGDLESTWRSISWAAVRGLSWDIREASPSQIQLLSDFIIDCSLHSFGSNQPVRSSTVKGNLAGIRHFIRAAGGDYPIDHPQIRMLVRGIARFDGPGQQKAPVSVAILEACYASLDLNAPADQALWGVLCLALFFLLRRSEIAATTRFTFQWFALNGSDIVVFDANGVPTSDPGSASTACIRLRGSKTNQSGKPVTRMLARSGHGYLCPVLGALFLMQARASLPLDIPVAVFTGADGRPDCISAATVSKAVKSGARAVGDDPKRFGTHSLRAGGATSMYRVGVDALTIQFHGRWASDAFKLYTMLCRESVACVAAKIVDGPRSTTVLQ